MTELEVWQSIFLQYGIFHCPRIWSRATWAISTLFARARPVRTVHAKEIFTSESPDFSQLDRSKKERLCSRWLTGRRWIGSAGIQGDAIHLRLLSRQRLGLGSSPVPEHAPLSCSPILSSTDPRTSHLLTLTLPLSLSFVLSSLANLAARASAFFGQAAFLSSLWKATKTFLAHHFPPIGSHDEISI